MKRPKVGRSLNTFQKHTKLFTTLFFKLTQKKNFLCVFQADYLFRVLFRTKHTKKCEKTVQIKYSWKQILQIKIQVEIKWKEMEVLLQQFEFEDLF